MAKPDQLAAVIQFKSTGELKGIFISASTDEEERVIKKALSRLIRPNFLNRIGRLFS